MSEHKEIWLEPRCNKVGAWCQRAEDRLWCEDGTLAACEDCGKDAVKYVPATDTEARADAAEALLLEVREVAGRVCRTAGIICESALANEANPETDDGGAIMFAMLKNAVDNVRELRTFLAETAPKPVRLGDEGEGDAP